MYYIITLTSGLQDGLRNGCDYNITQKYEEQWTIKDYHVDNHSIPVIDKVWVSAHGTILSTCHEVMSVVVEAPDWGDVAAKFKIFERGKALILKNPRMQKKLYFEEDMCIRD